MAKLDESNKDANLNEEQQQTGAEENQGAGTETDQEEKKQPTVEQLMAELAKANSSIAKLKNSLDEASSDAAKYKKALREKQSAEEIQSEEKQKEKEEFDKYVTSLESFKRHAEAKARYALEGLPEALAEQAAEAEVKGDFDALASIQRKHREETVKAKEKEWMKTRPGVNAGAGGNEEDDPFLKGFWSVPTRFGP